MALITETILIEKANRAMRNDTRYNSYSNNDLMKSLLIESSMNFSENKNYDIFLSHSYLDKKNILGLKQLIEDLGHTVYVDWIEDNQLNRNNINNKTAIILKNRMRKCKSLFYATSNNSTNSKWMPWECGFMDALKGKVAICPIVTDSSYIYKGQEYLGLYPYVDYDTNRNKENYFIWIIDKNDLNKYIRFDDWIQGKEPYIH